MTSAPRSPACSPAGWSCPRIAGGPSEFLLPGRLPAQCRRCRRRVVRVATNTEPRIPRQIQGRPVPGSATRIGGPGIPRRSVWQSEGGLGEDQTWVSARCAGRATGRWRPRSPAPASASSPARLEPGPEPRPAQRESSLVEETRGAGHAHARGNARGTFGLARPGLAAAAARLLATVLGARRSCSISATRAPGGDGRVPGHSQPPELKHFLVPDRARVDITYRQAEVVNASDHIYAPHLVVHMTDVVCDPRARPAHMAQVDRGASQSWPPSLLQQMAANATVMGLIPMTVRTRTLAGEDARSAAKARPVSLPS